MFIWEGIYQNHSELPFYKEFDSELWVTRQKEKLTDISINRNKYLIENRLLISIIKNNDKILDYGGSLGLTYEALSQDYNLKYAIVETKTICEAGKNIFKDKIQFYQEIPLLMESLDIVYIRTALQYAIDWKADLKKLLELKPCTIVMAHLSAGDIPTYLTLQKWYGTEIPYWFINESELIDLVEMYGYKIKHKAISESIIHWFKKSDGSFSIPKSHVLSETIDIIFEKIKQ